MNGLGWRAAAWRRAMCLLSLAVGGLAQAADVRPKALTVLMDQTDLAAGDGLYSQRFQADLAAYNTRAADDFVVPAGQAWLIKRLDIPGRYAIGTEPLRRANVIIFSDNAGRPDRRLTDQLVRTKDDGAARLSISLNEPVLLQPGRYWLSVQGRADLVNGVGVHWMWKLRSSFSGAVGQWENPGNGWATGCVEFTPVNACWASAGVGSNDFMFRLLGSIKALPTAR